MTALLFPWIEDLDRAVREKVLQPRSQTGQPRWTEREFEQAYNKAYVYLHREIGIFDRDYQSTTVDLVIPINTVSYPLPARTSFVRFIVELGADGRARQIIGRGLPEDIAREGWSWNKKVIYYPDQNVLYFTQKTTQPFTIRLIYGSYYVPLIHGAARVFGGLTMRLADYSSIENALYVGLAVRLVEGPGAGQEATVTAYNGNTQTVTVDTPWSPVGNDTTRYTSRPDLPWYAKDVYEDLVLACLYEKTDEVKSQKYQGLVAQTLNRMRTAIKEQARNAPDELFDQNLNGGWGDPADQYLAWN